MCNSVFRAYIQPLISSPVALFAGETTSVVEQCFSLSLPMYHSAVNLGRGPPVLLWGPMRLGKLGKVRCGLARRTGRLHTWTVDTPPLNGPFVAQLGPDPILRSPGSGF